MIFGLSGIVASSPCSRRSLEPGLCAVSSSRIVERGTSIVVTRVKARLTAGISKPWSLWVMSSKL